MSNQPPKSSKTSGKSSRKSIRPHEVPTLEEIFKGKADFLQSISEGERAAMIAHHEAEQSKTMKVNFRFTLREIDILDDLRRGHTRTEYVRAVLFEGRRPRAKRIFHKVNRDTYLELSRIGNNINQMAHGINAAVKHGFQPLTDEVRQFINRLDQTQALIAQARRELSGENDWEPETDGER